MLTLHIVCAALLLNLLVAFVPPMPRPVSLDDAGFEGDLRAHWRVSVVGTGVARPDAASHSGRRSVCMRAQGGRAVVELSARQLVPVTPGQGFKVCGWIRAQDCQGKVYLALAGYKDGRRVAEVASSQPLRGTTPGWVFRWAAGQVPVNGMVTHVGVVLRAQLTSGTAWFDDIALYSLPQDEPVYTGPPEPPPRGQVRAADGHLVDAHGRRVRLWGVNCVDAPSRTYREIAFIAHRVRQMGFNAVRLHLDDSRLIDTEATNPDGEKTSLVFRTSRRGDGSLLDRWDYFVYCCEREGLYLYMTFDRFGAKFAPGDYHVLPSAGAEDEAAWKKAVVELQPERADEHAYYVDARLGEAQARYVAGLLNHRNAYTGRRVADDPFVALYELTNENHFPEWMLRGGFRKWPDYFQKVLQNRWNAWLRGRYAETSALRRAWGKLRPGESLEKRTVRVAPTLPESREYPPARLADFHRFVYDLLVGYSRRLESIIRSSGQCAAIAPVSWDTIHEHKYKWYYPCSFGGLMTVGVYVHGPVEPDRRARRIRPDFRGFYNLSNAGVLGKPTVIYETNTVKPDYWRADYPLLIATFASTHDWDGVFWYNWADGTVRDEFDADTYWASGLRYWARTHAWHGVVTSTDEVLLSSMRLAGTIFLNFAVPPTRDPVIVTVGSNDLLGPSLWVGDIDVPFPADAPGPWKRGYAENLTDFLYTLRYRYDMAVPRSSLSRPLIARLPQPCRPVQEVEYDWERGVLKIDSPRAKAVVGFFGLSEQLTGGVSVKLQNRLDPAFACFGIASQDGRPLEQATRAVLILTTYGENRGRQLWPEPSQAPSGPGPLPTRMVKTWGFGPPDIARPAAIITLPGSWKWRALDFRLRVLGEGEGSLLRIPAGWPVYAVELSR